MTENNSNQHYKIVAPNSLDVRSFSFVTNKVLRRNASNTFSTIIFLHTLAEDESLPQFLKIQLYKIIIIQTIQILESLIVWKLLELEENGRIKQEDYQPKTKKYSYRFIKEIIQLDTMDKPLVAAYRSVEDTVLKKDIIFGQANNIARRIGLFEDIHFRKAEKLREKRNKIHLGGLDEIDDQYTEKQVDRIFREVSLLKDRIKNF